MMYFEKNMECIKKNRKYMYSFLENINKLSTTNRVDEIESIITYDSGKAIIIKYKGIQYRLNSVYRPVEEAKKWVKQYNFQNLNNIISMYGLGNGIFAKAIMEKMGENDTLLIYEPSYDIFSHVMHNYDIADILSDQRVSISIEKVNDFEFHNALRGVMNITNMSGQIMCSYPQYDKIFPESCLMFWKEIKETYYHTKTNVNTEIYFGKRFIDNALINTKFLLNSNTLLELQGVFPKDIPAIVVAAGPSVEKNIDELKKVKGKAVIFAVDRILDYLLLSGLEPDFVVTLDPMKPVDYFSKREDITIPLICFIEANHEILERHKGKKVICNCTGFLDKFYLDNNKVPPRTKSSASVATLAFTTCVELGFERIILVGQDLAYNEGCSHAGGIKEDYGELREVMLEDIHGNQVKSRLDWKEFVIWYQDMLSVFPELKVIDAKTEGAKIKGTIIMPLKEAISRYCETQYDFKYDISQTSPTFNDVEIKGIIQYLEDSLLTLDIIKKKSKDAIKECNILLKESKKSDIETTIGKNSINKISKITEFIVGQQIYPIMDLYINATVAQQLVEIYQFSDDVQDNSIKTYEKSINVFNAVVEAVEYIKPRLETAIDNVLLEYPK